MRIPTKSPGHSEMMSPGIATPNVKLTFPPGPLSGGRSLIAIADSPLHTGEVVDLFPVGGQGRRIGAFRNFSSFPPRADVGVEPPLSANKRHHDRYGGRDAHC